MISVTVDVELGHFETEDLIAELKSRDSLPEDIGDICRELQRSFEKQDRSEFDYFLNKIKEMKNA